MSNSGRRLWPAAAISRGTHRPACRDRAGDGHHGNPRERPYPREGRGGPDRRAGGERRVHGARRRHHRPRPGDDRGFGGRGNDTNGGFAGDDRIWGNQGEDVIRGDLTASATWSARTGCTAASATTSLGGERRQRLRCAAGPGRRQAVRRAPGTTRSTPTRVATRPRAGTATTRLFGASRKDVHGPNDTHGDTVRGGAGRRPYQDARRRGGRDQLRSRRRHTRCWTSRT